MALKTIQHGPIGRQTFAAPRHKQLVVHCVPDYSLGRWEDVNRPTMEETIDAANKLGDFVCSSNALCGSRAERGKSCFKRGASFSRAPNKEHRRRCPSDA